MTKLVDLSNNIDPSEQVLFLGKSDKIVRIDYVNNPVFKVLKENSEGNTWFTKELDFSSDKVRFNDLDDKAKRMFQLNIGYQTIMDSGASNGYLDTLSPITTDKMLQILYRRIGIEETIHSESYTYALNQVLGSSATDFINMIYEDPVVVNRMDNEIDSFEELDQCIQDLKTGALDIDFDRDEINKKILKTLVVTYLLEGIKFPFSFFVTFTINKSYNNCIQNITRLLKLIAHDEFNTHIVTHLHVIKILRKDPSQGFKGLFDNGWFDEMVTELTRTIVDQELDWNKYLLIDGSIPGYTEAIGEHFIKYQANLRLRGLQVNELYDGIESNDIIKWYDNYKDLNKTNVALQEASNTNYIKGNLTNDLGNFDNESEKSVKLS